MPISPKLKTFIARLVDERYGGKYLRLAESLGITVSSLHRGAKGIHGQTLSELTLLKLAYEAGEPAGVVLRLAGKDEAADVLARLYPAQSAGRLSGPERELLELWGGLKPDQQTAFLTLLRPGGKNRS